MSEKANLHVNSLSLPHGTESASRPLESSSSNLFPENLTMSLSALRVVCFTAVIFGGAIVAPAARAQDPCASQTYGYGNGNYQSQSFYGQPGIFPSQTGNYGAHYYAPSDYAPSGYAPSGYAPPNYAPQANYGLPVGYAAPPVIYNQSFYPGSPSYGNAGYSDHHHHHPWHLGHYLLGHH